MAKESRCGGDAQVERYVAALQTSAIDFCFRDAVNLYYAEFLRWSRQEYDFINWLTALRNSWIEALLEYLFENSRQ